MQINEYGHPRPEGTAGQHGWVATWAADSYLDPTDLAQPGWAASAHGLHHPDMGAPDTALLPGVTAQLGKVETGNGVKVPKPPAIRGRREINRKADEDVPSRSQWVDNAETAPGRYSMDTKDATPEHGAKRYRPRHARAAGQTAIRRWF